MFDWHTVTIAPTAAKSGHKGGTHASPRLHDRRGHWRTIKASGKRVWVRHCKVGDAAKVQSSGLQGVPIRARGPGMTDRKRQPAVLLRRIGVEAALRGMTVSDILYRAELQQPEQARAVLKQHPALGRSNN